jgi:hypothetical protein
MCSSKPICAVPVLKHKYAVTKLTKIALIPYGAPENSRNAVIN